MLDKQFEKKALKWKNIPSKRKPELEKWIQKQKEKYHWTENNGETMIDYFKNKYKPDSIISFVDKRISTGSLFKRNNFNKINESNPTFFVLGKNKLERLPNYKFKKHMLEKKLENFDKSLNEWENLKNNGYDRIWDCGYITFGWKK